MSDKWKISGLYTLKPTTYIVLMFLNSKIMKHPVVETHNTYLLQIVWKPDQRLIKYIIKISHIRYIYVITLEKTEVIHVD
jgi:hypothetical protein